MSIDDEVYSQAAAVETTPVLDPNEKQVLTHRCESTCLEAMQRGLREYVSQLAVNWSGKQYRFLRAIDGYAEPEERAKYPAVSVYTESPGVYDADTFSTEPHVITDGKTILQRASEYVQQYTVDIWCTQKEERRALIKMLEDAFDPVEWMSGFRLTLPHYFGAHATFLKDSLLVADTPATTGRRWFIAQFLVTGTVPQFRFVGRRPLMVPLHKVELTE
jgi:hypothetical protein